MRHQLDTALAREASILAKDDGQATYVRKDARKIAKLMRKKESGSMRNLLQFNFFDDDQQATRGKFWPQFQASMVGALTNLGVGVVIGYCGVTFPDLTRPHNHDLTLDQDEMELFGSMAYIGSVLGCFLSGLLMVWYGQRTTLLISLPVAMIGWIILGLGNSVWVLQFARLLLGVYVGSGFNSTGNFVAEISHHSIRGTLSGLVNVSRQFGFFFVYALGSTGITWRQLAFFSGGMTIVGPFFGLLSLPDSPRWLAMVRRFEDAKKSLTKLRGEIYDVDSELRMIIDQVERTENSGTVKQQIKEIANPHVLNRFILLNVLYILFSFTGNCCIVTYTASIFKEAKNYLNKYQSTIITGAARTLGSLVFLMVGDKIKRRDLMQLPMLVMAFCMLSLGFYFYFEDHHNSSKMRWVPLTSVVIHQFFVCFVPINFLLSELLPTSARSMGGSIIWMLSFGSSFIAVFTFPMMEDSMGLYGTFWLYSFCCLLFVVFTNYFLPESQGVPLEVLNEEEKDLGFENSIKKTLDIMSKHLITTEENDIP